MNDDRILPITRIVAIIVIPFLWLAFLILFFFPDTTGERFAWLIKPHLTSLYIGAGYLGGSWLFIQAVFNKHWHRIKGGFLPITTFTWFMLIATILHWDRFSHGTLSFTLWLVLYAITPFLVPVIWILNRKADSGQPEESDLLIPTAILWAPRLIAFTGLVSAALGIFHPDTLISIWPWALTPLTARIMSGWIALLGMGGLTMSTDRRWSAWKVPLQSILIWHLFVLAAFGLKSGDFTISIINWFTLSIGAMVFAILAYYFYMENKRMRSPR